MFPANLADDAWHGVGMARAVERAAGIVDVDALERGGEAIGVALAPDLTVGDDVQARRLLRLDGEDGRIILCFLQQRLSHAPKLARAHARREAPRKLLAVDQPFGLREAADQRSG